MKIKNSQHPKRPERWNYSTRPLGMFIQCRNIVVFNLRKLLILVACNLIARLFIGLYLLSLLDERPFHCQHCRRSFRESGALTHHLKSRVPCLTKSDTDLPRYGKTMTLQVMGRHIKILSINPFVNECSWYQILLVFFKATYVHHWFGVHEITTPETLQSSCQACLVSRKFLLQHCGLCWKPKSIMYCCNHSSNHSPKQISGYSICKLSQSKCGLQKYPDYHVYAVS